MAMNQLRRSARKFGGSGGGGPGARAMAGLLKAAAGVSLVGYLGYKSMWNVEGGQAGVVYSRLTGVRNQVYGEGTKLRLPFLEEPFIFDIRTRPETSRSLTGTKDLQMVDITVRVLYKPDVNRLPDILSRLGQDYNERVLPSIVNETLKAVIAKFNASQLITQRERVSKQIEADLRRRADKFWINVDDVSITHLAFGKEYTLAVEKKQIAQQQAERAKYLVQKAIQDKQSTIVRAEGEAKSAELIGSALAQNPSYVELRRLDTARGIAKSVASSSNQVYLNADSLLLNLLEPTTSAEKLGGRK